MRILYATSSRLSETINRLPALLSCQRSCGILCDLRLMHLAPLLQLHFHIRLLCSIPIVSAALEERNVWWV